jgi:glyoxylase-like metal-dependent hydrolase (beta-lactamase superfamily II)
MPEFKQRFTPELANPWQSVLTRIGGPIAVLAMMTAMSACSRTGGSLESAAKVLSVDSVTSLDISGNGKWFQFGQAPAPAQPWPPFELSSYSASINYAVPAARVQIARNQTVEPGRLRPTPIEQKADQYISGASAWNVAVTGITAQPAAVEERAAEIWATPQGFIKAAIANHATSKPADDNGVSVSFTVNSKYRYEGVINANNQVEKVRTWIDSPVLGDTLVETTFSNYKDFGGVLFPEHILRTQGGYPVLDLSVSAVKLNTAEDISLPVEVTTGRPIEVVVTPLAAGVYYFTGGTHHSVVIEQGDHVVVVEAPQNEARSLAVIAKVKETIPNKPIKYLVNTHAHFDHAGGVRTYVDEGAVIVTHADNRPYYEQAWAAKRTLNPDHLAQSNKTAVFETFKDKYVLNDDKRPIEIYPLEGSGHNDAFAFVYLPREKIVTEADAYTPAAADAPAPTSINPYSVNLYDNIQKLKLDVDKIAALHGPRVATITDLRAAINPVGIK